MARKLKKLAAMIHALADQARSLRNAMGNEELGKTTQFS